MTIANDAHHLARQLVALYGADEASDYAAGKCASMRAGDMDQHYTWMRVQEFIDATRVRDPLVNSAGASDIDREQFQGYFAESISAFGDEDELGFLSPFR